MVIGSFPDLCVSDVEASVAFYRALLGLDIVVDHGWYAELGSGGRTVLALVTAGHETVPARAGAPPRGVLVSFEVDDAAATWAMVPVLGCAVVAPLETDLGQRHFMVEDPDGAVVDVIERVPLTRADRVRLVDLRRRHLMTCRAS